MKKKIIVIVIMIIIVIIIAIGINTFIKNIKEDNKKTTERMNLIKEEYHNLEENIKKYNETRISLTNKLQEIYTDNLTQDYEKIKKIFQEQEQNIKENQKYVKILDNNCKIQVFSEKKVNTICSNYQQYYEQLVNVYWNDLMNFNKIIKNYNTISQIKLEEYISSQVTGYIDYNQDGEYLEKRDEE